MTLNKSIALRIPAELHEELEREAEQEHMSVSCLVRRLLIKRKEKDRRKA